MSAVSKVQKIEARIAALQAELVLAKAAAVNYIEPSRLVPGVAVNFNYGKGDKTKSLTGTIVAVKEGVPGVKGSATQFKIAHGEGFNADFAVVYTSAITSIVGEEPQAQPEAETEAAA